MNRARGNCLSGSPVILSLGIPQPAVQPVLLFHERLMAAPLYDPAVLKHIDGIAEPAAGHAVGNIDGSLIFYHLVKVAVYLVFRRRIQRGGGLV